MRKHSTNPTLTAAAATILQGEYPGLTAEELSCAVGDYRRSTRRHEPSERRRAQALTIREVAQRLGCSTRTTWRLCAEGALPVVRVRARVTRVLEADLERYLDRAGGTL